MDCLKNYIGISGCGWVPPVPIAPEVLADVFSGLYINQLPGISLKSIEKLADEEQKNFLGVWEDVQTRALLKFSISFRGKINTNHSITDKTIINCLICSNKELYATSLWYLMGAELMIERTSTDRLNRYTTIDLEKAEKLKTQFYTEYLGSFDSAICAMDINGSDCMGDECVECNGSNIFFVEAML